MILALQITAILLGLFIISLSLIQLKQKLARGGTWQTYHLFIGIFLVLAGLLS